MKDLQRQIILNALQEDLNKYGDITSNAIFNKEHQSFSRLVINENAVLAGKEVFKEVFKQADHSIITSFNFTDGDKVNKNDVICEIKGSTLSILQAERTAINFISHMSGIATLTNELAELIKYTGVTLLDTRKTTPNLRYFEKNAVLAGGGKNHRFGLYDRILIKDNHISVCRSIEKAVLAIKKQYGKKYKIEVEVNNTNELKEAINCDVDIIMFDNWTINDLKNAVKLVPVRILTEASGQISKENIKEYAETGVNYISTSYMIKNAKWTDFSLNIVSPAIIK